MASKLEVGDKLQAKFTDGEFYPAEVLVVSTSAKRSKAPVKVSYKGYGAEYAAWLPLDSLKSKKLPKEKTKAKAKAKAAPPPDYSVLEKGARLQVKADDGKFYAATVVTVAKAKAKATAPVKINYVGYTSASDEWVGADRIRSKALTASAAKAKAAKAKSPIAGAYTFMTIQPTFTILDEKKAKPIMDEFIEKTKTEKNCIYYGWQKCGSKLFCSEAYVSPQAVSAHLENIGSQFKAMLDGPAKLDNLEIHGTKKDLEKLKKTIEDLKATPMEVDSGIAFFSKRTTAPKTDLSLMLVRPYFTILDEKAALPIMAEFVKKTKTETGCIYYGWTKKGDKLHCREAYVDAAAVAAHLENIGDLFKAILDGPCKLDSLEFHGPEAEITKLKPTTDKLSPTYFTTYGGFGQFTQAPKGRPQLEGKMGELWPTYQKKMKKEGLNTTAIKAFKYNFNVLVSGANVMIPESVLSPVESLTTYESLSLEPKPELLKQTVILKLNGGLGTGMGLDKAKSLLTVTDGKSFLDLIALQVDSMKKDFKQKNLKFMLMNSFSTSADTKKALKKYKSLGKGSELEFVQNKAPKVTASDFTPVEWPADKGHEWCPPGHGDLYPAMLGSGTLEALLKKGFKYMFVSNSDNLGATMDLKILTHFASTSAPFMMEVAVRTDADKKGGHLAKDKATGGLLLRESAQCPEEDEKEFQNVGKYKFFNTNNLWVDLEALMAQFKKHKGTLPLPVMKNDKTVDPRDKASTKVIQLETAMGAAIGCFDGAQALVIPRSRFAPVKTTNDLVALRSDAYVLTKDYRIELAESRKGVPPNIKLDGMYKFVDAMDKLIPEGAPSLIDCEKLVVEGPVTFAKGVVVKGSVTFKNSASETKTVAAGTYENKTVTL
jgi:UDP-N-acetylglucosamine pyrophosphorylase/quinol monooxygenase YgiN